MRYEIKKFGTGLHIVLPLSHGWVLGQTVNVSELERNDRVSQVLSELEPVLKRHLAKEENEI